MTLRIVGKSITKPDALDKVTGKALYVGDLYRPDMLYGRAVRSPHAHARILNIDISFALAVPGVKAVLTPADIPGENHVGMTGSKDQRVLAEGKVRFFGEAVAVVAAETPAAADKATRLVKVAYEELPVVENIEQGLAADAPQVSEAGNICWHGRVVRGDYDDVIAGAPVVISGEYRTDMEEHAYIEPEAVLAEPEGDGLLIWSSTKSVFIDRNEIARFLGLPVSRVHVVAPHVGGSFGGKPDLPLNCMAALLCWKTGRPVSMVMEREESMQVTTKRHAMILKLTHGADRDGNLLAVKLEVYGDAGGYIDYTPAIMQRTIIHGAGPYRVPNVCLEGKAVLTNNPPGGAMRGFGMPQIVFAIERQMDRLAQALGKDPLELRLQNAFQKGDKTPTGQVLDHEVTIKVGLERAREIISADPAGAARKFERAGWGMACFYFGNGRTAMPNPGKATCRLLENGKVQVAVGSPDVGQGSNLILAQIAAEALNLDLHQVELVTADTALTPDSGTTSGTRVTAIVGKSVQLACEKWRREIIQAVAAAMNGSPDQLDLVGGMGNARISGGSVDLSLREVNRLLKERGVETEITFKYDPPTSQLDKETGQGAPYHLYTYGVQLAKVRVNGFTGQVSVDRLVSILDIGRVVNPLLLVGQVEGGAAMGLGYALMEEINLKGGKVLNSNFKEYLIPTTMDVCQPELFTIFTNDLKAPFGAKGVGEPASIPVAAAIANAVSAATGVDYYHLPLNLERVAGEITRS